MSTVILDQVKIQLTVEQIVAAFQQLSPEERTRVWRELDRRQWQSEFRALLKHIHARVSEPYFRRGNRRGSPCCA